MRQKSALFGLSALTIAVFTTYPLASAAVDISSETTYDGPYNENVTISSSGTLSGNKDETEMVFNNTLNNSGTIKDAASVTVSGSAVNNDNATIEVGSLFTGSYTQNKGGTIKVDSFGSEEQKSEFYVEGGNVTVTGDSYFTGIRIGNTEKATTVSLGGTTHTDTGFALQDADASVTLHNVAGQGGVSATAGTITVTGNIDIDNSVAARNSGSVINVTGHIDAAQNIQTELGGSITASSGVANQIYATGEGSSIHITGAAKTNKVQVGAGSALQVGSLSANTGDVIESFSSAGAVTISDSSLSVKTFSNQAGGTINADEQGTSHLDQLTVTQGAYITGDLNVRDFNTTGSLTVNENSKVMLDKLGTRDSLVQAVTIKEGSTINVAGDAYFNNSISGPGDINIGGQANMVAGYQELRTKMTAGSMDVLGFTALQSTAALKLSSDLTAQDAATLVIQTAAADFDIGGNFVLNDGAKVQLQSDGVEIDHLILNTNEKSYFQVYKNSSINTIDVNGVGRISTWGGADSDSSIKIGTLNIAADAVANLVNEGTYQDYSSTASIEHVTLADGASLVNSGGSITESDVTTVTPPFEGLSITSLEGVNGTIQNRRGGSMRIGTLSGSGNVVEVETVESGVTIDHNASTGLIYRTGADDADKLGTQGALEAVAEMIGTSDNTFETQVADGVVNGGGSATFDADGNMIFSSTGESYTMSALKQFNNATLVQWRYETNHLSERLGEVRSNLGAAGGWARIYGADSKVSDNVTTEVKSNTIQVGADATIDGNWIVGGAFSYTNMDGDITNGQAEGETYSLAAYASGFFDCGGYIDVIGRIGRMSTDIDAYTTTGKLFDGSYDNTALGLSAEVGYHWNLSQTFFVEPQAELSYGYVLGDDFKTSSNIKVEQDDFQSLVGRLGARFGANFPEKAGSFYVQASVNHEFLGDNDFDAAYEGYSKQHFSSELDGTWVSYGVGMQINATDALSFYGSLSRANGDDYQDDYRYSVGARYVW